MTALELNQHRLSVYDISLASKPRIVAPTGVAFVYVARGTATLDGSAVEADNGHFATGPFSLSGAGTAWLYEFAPITQSVLEGDGISLVISRRLPQAYSGERIFRADRVESNPGSQTPLHGHRGPGIRRLLKGRLHAYIGEDSERIDAGHAWFESGKDWVVGKNIHDSNSAFIRVMILPAELSGGTSSFVPATPEEANKPRSVTYRLFGERPC
ncbi:hypothetical protein [Devosia submarina]|uniref:hypothetical protein n=1 Tax=Devosia submarina TaxID=1173082 RepID=UPI000D354FAD|nr:hypothetical protein [Devosia submarina]